MESWDELLESAHKMVLVMASLNVPEYTRCLILHLNVVSHHQQQETGVYDMFKSNPGAFNEESGEMSFSVLARASVSDTQKMKFEHMNKLYKLLHVYREITEELNDDLNGPMVEKKFSTGRYIIDPNSVEVAETVSYFRGVIRDILAQAHTTYDGTLAGYQSKAAANKHQVEFADFRRKQILQPEEALNEIHKQKLWMEKKFDEFWIADHIDVWPSAAFDDEAHDSDEFLSADDDENAVGVDPQAEDLKSDDEVLHDEQRQDKSSGSSEEDRPLVRGRPLNTDPKSPGMIKKKGMAKKKRKVVGPDPREPAPESPIRMEPDDDDPDESEDEEKLYVEKLICSKVKKGRTYYRVRWEGYKPEDDTFESHTHLVKCMGSRKVLREFIEAMREENDDNEDID